MTRKTEVTTDGSEHFLVCGAGTFGPFEQLEDALTAERIYRDVGIRGLVSFFGNTPRLEKIKWDGV